MANAWRESYALATLRQPRVLPISPRETKFTRLPRLCQMRDGKTRDDQQRVAQGDAVTSTVPGATRAMCVGNPTLDTLFRLAAALEVNVSDLVDYDQAGIRGRLSSSDYRTVRDARDSLDGVLRRLQEPSRASAPSAAAGATARARPEPRDGPPRAAADRGSP